MCRSGKIFLPASHIYGIVAVTAFALRGFFLLYWLKSPLAFFHLLPGLDMASHLNNATRLGAGEVPITLYRLLVLAVRGNVAVVIACQMMAGIVLAVLAAYVTLHMRGNRLHALAAGMTAALYGAALMYEATLLQETVTVLATFGAFAGILYARRRHFTTGRTIFAGALLALAGTGRPVGLLLVAGLAGWGVLYQYRRRKAWRRTALLIAGTLFVIWTPLSILNYRFEKMPLPFYISNARYIVDVIAHGNRTAWDTPAPVPTAPSESAAAAPSTPAPSRVGKIVRVAEKFPMLFSPVDLPDNVNYTFFRAYVPGFGWLIPPGALVPAGLAGMLALLIARRRRDALAAVWYVVPLALVVAAYFPSGRHRLILYPALAIYAWYPLFMPKKRLHMAAGVWLLAIGVYGYRMPDYPRAADYANWGMALEKMDHASESAEPWFARAYELAPSNPLNLVRIMQPTLRRGDREQAERWLGQYRNRDSFHAYYTGILAMWRNDLELATAAFREVKPEELTGLQRPYHFYYAEVLRGRGKNRQAVREYDLALRLTQDPEQRARIERSRAQAERDM